MNYAFISHSSADKELAERLAKKLGEKNVFFDLWDLDSGDLVPKKLAEAIHESKWFILLASRKAMESHWVRYEINIAIINTIENEDFRIIAARIDDCEIHPELMPYNYIDFPNDPELALNKIVEGIVSKGDGIIPPTKKLRRRPIVNRFKELEAIEDLANEGIRFIFLWGLYGIGKTVLAEQAILETFNSRDARISFTNSHGLLKLTLELTAKAGRLLPLPSATDNELIEAAVSSVINLVSNGYIVFFDNFEYAVEEDASLKPYILLFLENLGQQESLTQPIIFASQYYPKLPADLEEMSHITRIGPLDDKHLLFCLENWLRLSDPKNVPGQDTLKKIVPFLHGYPLAARLASSMITKYSAEVILNDVSHFKSLKLDIAKQLLGRTRKQLTELEVKCLEALAIADSGLSLSEMSNGLERNVDEVRFSIDNLVSTLIIFPENGRLQIHPIIKDFFWNSAYKSSIWKELAGKLGEHARRSLASAPSQSEEFVHLCSKAFRLLILAGKDEEAKSLAYYFREELRATAQRLYHAKNYSLSLKYIDLWLEINNNDRQIRWLKARCLTRLKRVELAEDELNGLEKIGYLRYKLDHAWGLLKRDENQLEEAISFFENGLKDREEYIPLLRDLGDVLDRVGKTYEAVKKLRTAYNLAPTDSYVVAKFVDLLAKTGEIKEALVIMKTAHEAFPDKAVFEHRMSTLLCDLGEDMEGYIHAKKAVELDDTLYEAVLHLSALELKRDNLQAAEDLFELIPEDNITDKKRLIKSTIQAEIKLKQKDLEGARSLLRKYDILLDPYCADVSARIELSEAMDLISKKQIIDARKSLGKGKEIIELAVKKFKGNMVLTKTKDYILNLENQIT